ncbi:MAG: hypothetical protein AAGC81_13330 [Pseudomonadota bacterium]
MMMLLVYLIAVPFILFTVLSYAAGPDRYLKWLAFQNIVGAALALGLAAISTGVFYNYDGYYGDFWVTMDAMNKVKHGSLSSIDFFSPIGPAFFWVLGATISLTDEISASSVMRAGALVAAFAVIMTAGMLWRRISFLGLTIVLFTVVTVAVSGRGNGEILSHAHIHFLAPYNRWAWALFIPVALRLSLPDRGRDLLGDVLIGVAIALLLLTKVTYGAAGLGLLFARVVLVQGAWREMIGAVLAIFATLVVAEIATGQLFPYLDDLSTVASLPQSGFRVRKLMFQLGELFVYMSIGIVVYVVSSDPLRERSQEFEPKFRYFVPIFFIVIVALAGCAVLLQNHNKFEASIYPLLPLIALEWTGVLRLKNTAAMFEGFRSRILITFTVLFMILLPIFDLGMYVGQRVNYKIQGPDPAFAGTPYADLRFANYLMNWNTGLQSVATARDGVLEGYQILLEAGAAQEDAGRVVALSFSNPFPLMLGQPSPLGTPIWYDHNRSFTDEVFVDPDVLFEGADYVVRGKFDAELWRVYGSIVEAQFEQKFKGKFWTLYVRAQ